MHLQQLSFINFKNYASAEFDLIDGVNCFIGTNGSGKTNVLDAVHYLSICKSYLNQMDRQNIAFNEQFMLVQGNFLKDKKVYAVHLGLKHGGKKVFKCNKVEYDRLGDHIGLFPCVMISPYDTDLIADGSEVRRRWIDSLISQFDAHYLENLQLYNKVLDQRNSLLKHQFESRMFEPEALEVWDDQLVRYGNIVYEKRAQFLVEFIPLFNSKYTFLAGEAEIVSLEYKSQMNTETFEIGLKNSLSRDRMAHNTGVGIHKDDLIFTIGDNPIKKFGSQGQQKSFLIALRLAQFETLRSKLNIKPVLLLDDIFDKLDNQRVGRLMSLVSNHEFGQVLVTDTDQRRVEAIFQEIDTPIKLFKIHKGVVLNQDGISKEIDEKVRDKSELNIEIE
jgi:DNA replication and repair protein RecF